MIDDTTNTEQNSVAADCPNERIVMWGDFEVTNYAGPVDFANWDFGDETPWLACENDGFQVVTPNWAYVDGEMDCMQAGISFISMIEDYKETFLEEENEKGKEKEIAIACLKKAISILEAT
jgi:hypothetical protein